MKKNKIDTKTSLELQGIIETGDFTYQDILNHFEDRFTLNQIKYHIKKHYPNLKHKIKKEYSRGGSKLLYLLKQIFPLKYIESEYKIDNLRLDFYIKHPFKLGFEFDGIQHFENNNFFYNSNVDFELAQQRDKFKTKRCQQLGIKLIRLTSHEKLTKKKLLKLINQEISLDQLMMDMKLLKKDKEEKEKPSTIHQKKPDWKLLYQKKKKFQKDFKKEKTEEQLKYEKKMKEKQKAYRKSQYQKMKKKKQEWNRSK